MPTKSTKSSKIFLDGQNSRTDDTCTFLSQDLFIEFFVSCLSPLSALREQAGVSWAITIND